MDNQNTKIYIYALCEPVGKTIRYIGKSIDPQTRLLKHIYDSLRGKTHKHHWINELLNNNSKPILKIIEECSNNNWKKKERYWIKYYRDKGLNLTNITDGGDGSMGTDGVNTTMMIRLNNKMFDRLKKQAKKEGRSFSEIIRKLILDFLDEKEAGICVLKGRNDTK